MSNEASYSIDLSLAADPHLARLVRMSAANVAMLSSMSVERVEDIKMAAEEAFIYACSSQGSSDLSVHFVVDSERVAMEFGLTDGVFARVDDGEADAGSIYADLILASVCDVYEKSADGTGLHIELEADV